MTIDCIHHWLLPTPNHTDHITGVCQKCGETREYDAYFDEDTFRKALQMSPHKKWFHKKEPVQVL